MKKPDRPVILVSNDDGIHAPGIVALASALEAVGEVWVVAPDRERSAVGHALTLHRPLTPDQLGPRRFSVNGTPSDCVNLALLGLLPALLIARQAVADQRDPALPDLFARLRAADAVEAPAIEAQIRAIWHRHPDRVAAAPAKTR